MARSSTSLVPTAGSVQSPFGILSPATTTFEYSEDFWTTGITYSINDAGVVVKVSTISGASPSDSATIIDNSSNNDRFDWYYPFDIQASVKVSTMGTQPDEIQEAAESALILVTQKALEIEFWDGTATKLNTEDNDNRYLAHASSIDVTPTPGTAIKPRYGQAVLEQAIASSPLGGVGLIHATRDVASVLKVKADGDVLRTNLGTPLVAGTGYSKKGPTGVDAPAGQAWMYATGPVSVHLGQTHIIPEKLTEAVDTRINTVEYFVSRPAAITWSTHDSYAVLVDLSLDYA